MSTLTYNYGELRNDTKFINTVENVNKSLEKIEQSMLAAIQLNDRQNLSLEDKIKLDNYILYAINSLYWMHIKLQGQDPSEHDVKNELSRIRQTILRYKEIHERNTIRPAVDKEAASRFIKRGLHLRFDENGKIVQSNHKKTKLNN